MIPHKVSSDLYITYSRTVTLDSLASQPSLFIREFIPQESRVEEKYSMGHSLNVTLLMSYSRYTCMALQHKVLVTKLMEMLRKVLKST